MTGLFLFIDLSPLLLSLKLATITTLILLLAGLPLAWWFAGRQHLFKNLLEILFTMPLVLPPSVLGFYLLIAFNPLHNPARWLLSHFSLHLAFSFEGLLAGSVLYSLPFMLTPLKAAFQHLPANLTEASMSMGKSKGETFLRVLIPAIRPSILSAAILTFAHTLGEFGIVLMIGGNIPGKTRLASMAIYDAVENMDYDTAAWYSIILFSMTFILISLVFLINKRVKSNLEQ